jgi:hypothetical protein
MIDAAKKAAQGTISEYELILNANRAIQFEVAKTPEAFAKLIELSTALGRAQGIADTQALEFLTTGLARESRLILDNLGLIIDLEAATKRYADTIGKSADQLTTAERKQALLEEAFRQGATAIEANRDAADSAATQFERLDANSQNLRDLLGELIAQGSAAYIASLADALEHASNVLDGRAELPGWLDGMGQAALDAANDMEASTIQTAVLRQAMAVLGASVVGFNETVRAGAAKELTDAFDQMEGVVTNAGVAIDMTGQKAKAVSAEILTLYGDQESSINKALMGRAEKSVDTIGADQALAQYRQAKQDAEAALQSLMDAGVTDATELQFRSAEILTSLLVPFDELEARANQIDFSAMSGAISSLNAGFVDFLPGVSSAREELASLSQEMMFSSTVTAEQLAQFEYLSAVAYSVADGGSQLSAVINDLGNDFLASNAYAAELVNQLVLTEAAYRNGAISGDIYAGVTATLTGQLLTLAQGAGIATGAIYALNSAQADMASPAGLAIGGSIANRIQSQQQTSGREQNRREMERYNKDLARSQERSAGRAGKLLEDGAKKANQELKSALDKVPGLFSASQVTEQDMKDAELGVYQEKADEYLRRLRDEVQNGNDWEDVSLEEARAGLERAGLEVGSTAEQTVALLEKAINDSSLYSAVENIPIFINEEAVKFTQELQSKSEQGRKNIYEYFGIQVDEAVGAATGGGGGGGGVAVRPPELIDIDPLTEGLQTGLDEYVNASGEMVKEQMAKAKALFFDPANLFGSTAASGKPGAMGPVAKPEITVTADATAQAWLPVVTGQTTTATVALGVAGPQAAPSMDGEKTKLLITDYYEVVTPEGGKVKLAAADFFTFDGSAPVETVNRADLVTFTNALPVEQVNRAKLVSFLSELPTEQIDRSALVAFVSEVSKEEIDRSGLVSFLSELPTEQVDRSTLIGYINSPATETVDRAELISFANALPAENIDRSALISFLGSVPSEAVDRQTLVSYLNSVPTETIDRANVVAFLGSVPSEQVDRSALVAFVSEVSKEEIDRSGLVSFLSELPTEQVDRSTLIGYINSPATETIDRAKLVTAINELPIQEVNRQTLVSYLNALPSETVDRSTLVGFVNAIPAENVDRSALVSFANAVPTEHVDRSDLIAFVNALPAENIDRSALVSFLGSVPSEAVDRQTLVSYLNSVPTETIDRANVVAFLGNVTSEQVDRTALVAYIGAVPIFTVDLSKVVEFAGEAVRAAQDKLYSFLYGPSPERPDTAPGITDAGPYAIDIQAQLSPAAYQSYLDYKAEVEANPPTIMPMLQAPGQRLGDVEPLGTIDVTANITKFDVTAQIDETALASLTAPIVYAPQSDAQADFITPLVTGLTTQIGANQDQIGAQGASVAQIIIAGMIAAFQGTQQGGEATTTISDALFFAVNTQFTTAQSSFFTVGSIPAVAVESGFKGYAYDGLSSGLLDALTNGIRADADAYMQRGATIAGYVQKGIGDGFSSDIGIRSAVTAGGVWGNAFMQGALNAINAAGFVDQITTAVVDGITDQVEQP